VTTAEAARHGDTVVRVFMGGRNEDRATPGYNVSHPGVAFLDVPKFLSNGTRDSIAGASASATVRQSMEQIGFRRVRLEGFDDQHLLIAEQLWMALQWFRLVPERTRAPMSAKPER